MSDTQEAEDDKKTSESIYYIDMSNFKEGDVAVNPKDQSKYVIREVGVLREHTASIRGTQYFAGSRFLIRMRNMRLYPRKHVTDFPDMIIL